MRTPITLLFLVVFAAVGCAGSNSTKEENALLREENQTLRAQLDDRNSALETSSMELRDRSVELAELRQRLEEARNRPAPEPVAATTGFEGIAGVTGSLGAGEVTATVENDILFDSGQSTIKRAARRSLDAVADVLNSSYAGRSIRVAGHTDTDPIKKSGFKSNHHLGFERAFAVREYLVSRGVSPGRIYLASHGPDRPLGGKAQSRRVEIVVVLN